MIKGFRESIETSPSTNDLRSFGLLVGVVVAIIGIWPFVFRGEPTRPWTLALGTSILILAAVCPSLLLPLHKVWMTLGYILGWINTRIILSIIFYGMITPIGLIFRLMRKDPMRKLFIADHHTYRVPKDQRPRGHMKYQF